MFKYIRDSKPCLPNWWINFTQRYSFSLVIIAILVTTGVLVYTVKNFKINTDLADMVSDRLHFRKVEKELDKAFPQLSHNIVVVIDADTPERALFARKLLANRLVQEKEVFEMVFIPEGGSFFEKNGLLYMSVDELEDLTDSLADIQPFLAILSRDFSLSGFFSVLEKVLQQPEDLISDNERLLLLFESLSDAFESTINKKPFQLSWQEIMTGNKVEKNQLRQLIIVKPFLDYNLLYPAKAAIDKIRRLTDELQFNNHDIQVRITGGVVLNHDDLISVQNGIRTVAIVSFILVLIVLYIGLRSSRLVLMSLITLIMGLIWTMGFAIAFIGSLNLISITFVVLFIGLGIDYSIQFCLRYKELICSGHAHGDAIIIAAKSISNALILCSITTAIGFYAFVPTSYSGASELGMISGTGMFIILFANLSVLPALLKLLPPKKSELMQPPVSWTFSALPDKYPRIIVAGAIILTIGALTLLPKVGFDFNPLNISNQTTESFKTAKELFAGERTSPWTISVLANSIMEAKELSSRLRNLKEVDTTISIADFIPEKQPEKLDIIYDIALLMPEIDVDAPRPFRSYEETVDSLRNFELAIRDYLQSSPNENSAYLAAIRRLNNNIKRLNVILEDSEDGQLAFSMLEEGILSNLSILLGRLEKLLQPSAFNESDLPPQLIQRYVSGDGRYRIQVFPHENLFSKDALKRFVAAVRKVAPDATDAPVTILESGRAIVSAFKLATLFALGIITIFLITVLRKFFEVVLILIPLLLAILLTVATSVLLKIPFNFANIIAIPLLLGIGADYGIHLVYRFTTELPEKKGILHTSTARAVLFSALTTIVSFGSLSFLSHAGVASMGKLLTICNGFMIICNLIILPAILSLFYKRRDSIPSGEK